MRRFGGRELVGDGGIVDAGSGLFAPEFVRELVGVPVKGDVAESPTPEMEAAFSPRRLEDRKALFLGNVEGGAFVGLDIEQASAGLRAPAEPFRIVCLHRVLRRRIECLLL